MESAGALSLSGINPQEVTADILCEFMEVAFHLILYVREVYPPVVFQRRQKYSVPVQMCVHPQLNQYIQDVLCNTRLLIVKKAVEKVVLVIKSKTNHQPLERYVFNVEDPVLRSEARDDVLVQLEASLRAFLLKIAVCDAMLAPTPSDGSTFSVLVYAKHSAVAGLEHDDLAKGFPWVQAEPEECDIISNPIIIPLKSVSSSLLKLQLYVEENRAAKS
ncbi:hypothetical protein EMCRGX_G016720 [Ephydatia muelleri]